MEIKINIEAKGLEEAIHALAKAMTGIPVSQKPAVEVTPSVGSTEETGPDTSAPKPEVKKEAPVEPPVEEPKAEPSITLETVRQTLAKFSQTGRQSEAKAILTSFNVQRLSDLPTEQYAAILEKANEAL